MKESTEKTEEKKEKILKPRTPCREGSSHGELHRAGRVPQYYDALPHDVRFAYMTPGFYATGFRILDVYKTKVDLSENRSLIFLEDPLLEHKWGHLKSRIPYPEGRITDLPGTKTTHYKNYCLRSMTPNSAKSWRKMITEMRKAKASPDNDSGEQEPEVECVCEK